MEQGQVGVWGGDAGARTLCVCVCVACGGGGLWPHSQAIRGGLTPRNPSDKGFPSATGFCSKSFPGSFRDHRWRFIANRPRL